MTTLPQNPSMRLPRASSSASPTGGAAPSGMTGADVFRVLRGNLWLILLLLVVSGVLGFVANMFLARNHSKFTSEGLLQVNVSQTLASMIGRSGGPSAGGAILMSNDSISIEQRTQVQGLRSESLFSDVLKDENSQIRTTSWFKRFDSVADAKEDLSKNFSVSAINETRLIAVRMTYSNPEEARLIAQAIVDRHLSSQRGVALDETSAQQGKLTRLRSKIQSDLNAAAAERSDLAKRLSDAGVPPGARVSSKDIEIEATTRGLIEAQQRLGVIRGQFQSLQTQMTEGTDPPMLLRFLESNEAYQRLQQQLREIDNALRAAERGGESSPTVRRLRDQRIATDTSLTDFRQEQLAKLKASVPESLRSEEMAADAAVKDAQRNLEQIKAEASTVSDALARHNGLAEREAQLRANLLGVTEAIDAIQVEQGRGGPTLEWYFQMVTPDMPSFPKLPVTLTVALVLGLGLALAIAFARELLDSTIRSPRDVAKVGGIAVLGTVQHESDDPQSAGARLPLVIAEAPQSMTAEQLRQIRTRLQHSSSLDSLRSLMVTSGNPGDGKTTVAANLAAGLALVGRKILLVDANFRRPELHKLFGIENKDGFSNVLTAPEQLAGAVKASKIPNLTILPSGAKPSNAAELLESVLLENFIAKALETYDHVIFDTGPLLFASESVAMAPRVDGVITVVRANESSRGVLGRIRDMLKQIKAENLGVVINGIRAHGGGYHSRNIKTYYEYANNNG